MNNINMENPRSGFGLKLTLYGIFTVIFFGATYFGFRDEGINILTPTTLAIFSIWVLISVAIIFNKNYIKEGVGGGLLGYLSIVLFTLVVRMVTSPESAGYGLLGGVPLFVVWIIDFLYIRSQFSKLNKRLLYTSFFIVSGTIIVGMIISLMGNN